MEKVMLYPFERSIFPLLKYKFYPKDWEIVKLVSPKGWGNMGKDAGDIDFSENIGIQIESNFEKALEVVDTVVFMQTDMACDYDNFIKPKIIKSIQSKKNVVLTLKISEQEKQEFENMSISNKVVFSYYDNHLVDLKKKSSIDIYAPLLHEIEVPVLMIFGVMEQVGKFSVQLAAKEYFENKKYSVSLVSSKSYAKLGNSWPIPDIFYDSNYNEVEKIILFNSYLSEIEKVTNPDILIIGVPGGIIPTNTAYVNKFGITAFEITRAVEPDASLLCSQFIEGTEDYFERLSNIMKFRFSADLDGVIIDRTMVDFNDMGITNKVRWTRMPSTSFGNFENECKSYKTPVRVVDDQTELFEAIFNKLTNNIEVL